MRYRTEAPRDRSETRHGVDAARGDPLGYVCTVVSLTPGVVLCSIVAVRAGVGQSGQRGRCQLQRELCVPVLVPVPAARANRRGRQ